MSVLDRNYFRGEAAAFTHLESILWPDGPVCPHCGTIDKAGKLKGVKGKNGKVRPGLWKCYSKECRKQFTVRVGTVFESSHIPLHKALQAVHLMCSSKKGISAHQLHRTLEVDYKSAWFLAHRIREAMRDGTLGPLGGEGKTTEADETYFGRKKGFQSAGGGAGHKMAILGLVERDGGPVRTFHIPTADRQTVESVVRMNIARESKLHTDESKLYGWAKKHFAGHETVIHSEREYVHYQKTETADGASKTEEVHTNTLEGYFSIFKRGMKGVYQHCGEKHLHRYLAEFAFRYNNRVARGVDDNERAGRALKGIVGKRLTYRQSPSHI